MSSEEPSVLVVGGRKRGRPASNEPSSTVSVWMFSRHHDRLIQMARERGVSVSCVARQLLEQSLKVSR